MSNELTTYFENQRQWVTDFLDSLLRIPSESGSEQRAEAFLYGELRKLGANCELSPIKHDLARHNEYSDTVKGLSYGGRSNISLTKAGTGGKTIALNSHFDVVPPSPGQTDAYTPKLDEDGYVHARGACDAKGQLAAMALVVKAASELPPLGNTVVCHMVVEEELGGNGTLAILENAPDFSADALINMEPTDIQLKPSIRGAVWFDMLFTGQAGHAGSAGNTQSSVYSAMAAIDALKAYHAELLEQSKDYGLFKGAANPMPLTIGQFQAGVWPSMVPGEARIRGVLGFLPNKTRESVMRDIRELFLREENRWFGEKAQIHFDYRHNAVETDVEHWLVKGMQQACAQNGLSPVLSAMTASTDAVFYSDRGIPCMAFGPGKIEDAHSSHEKISISDIIKAAQTLYTFLKMI